MRPHICTLGAAGFTTLAGIGVADSIAILLLALSAGLLIVGGPLAAVSAVVAALPVWMLQVPIGGTSWSPLELALLAGAGVAVLYAGLDLVRSRRVSILAKWLPPADLIYLAAVLSFVAIVSLAWVAEPSLRSDSIRALRRTILEPMLILPAAAYAVRCGWHRQIAIWIAAPAIGISLVALAQFASDRSTVDIGGFARPIGTFTHPNNLAFYLERAIWFVPLAVLFGLRSRRMAIALGGLVFVAALATLSRGLLLGLAVGGTVYGLSLLRRQVRVALGIAGAVFALVLLTRYFSDSENSLDARMAIWRSSLSMLRDYPFTGVGLDQFFGQYGTRYVRPEGWAERYTSHPHNILLDFWLSLGLAGAIVLWLFGEAIRVRLRESASASDWSYRRAAVALLVAGAAHGLVDNGFFLPDLATWTWLGLVLAGAQSGREDDRDQ